MGYKRYFEIGDWDESSLRCDAIIQWTKSKGNCPIARQSFTVWLQGNKNSVTIETNKEIYVHVSRESGYRRFMRVIWLECQPHWLSNDIRIPTPKLGNLQCIRPMPYACHVFDLVPKGDVHWSKWAIALSIASSRQDQIIIMIEQ